LKGREAFEFTQPYLGELILEISEDEIEDMIAMRTTGKEYLIQ
jgi:hypothetical protein